MKLEQKQNERGVFSQKYRFEDILRNYEPGLEKKMKVSAVNSVQHSRSHTPSRLMQLQPGAQRAQWSIKKFHDSKQNENLKALCRILDICFDLFAHPFQQSPYRVLGGHQSESGTPYSQRGDYIALPDNA